MDIAVYFFGGYNAAPADMDMWSTSVIRQCANAKLVTFPWQNGPKSNDKEGIIATFKNGNRFASLLKDIQSLSVGRIYIVGHSSGCAIANEIDRNLNGNDKVNLVVLDGFAPDRSQLARPSTQVWAADCGTIKSMNYSNLEPVVHGRLKVYHAQQCRTKWPLHFSLVNTAANDTTVKTTASGYSGCNANLCWLL